MAGKIKVIIEPNGATAIDMSGFKTCSKATDNMLKTLDMTADSIRIKEEEVQTVTTANNHINVKRK
jgi:hypothetical protein